jgi:hypothetical protein
MIQWMLLGEVIGLIGSARLPVNNDMKLFDTFANPVQTHVHGFGAVTLYNVSGDYFGTFVVCLYGSTRLWITQF